MTRPTLILIFGESENDTGALKRLIPALAAPRRVECRPIRRPIILAQRANFDVRQYMSRLVAAAERGEVKAGRTVVVVAHRDCDDVEPTHVACGVALVADLKAAGVQRPVAAIPAWDIEAWWLLFPDALQQTRGCWKKISIGQRRTGMIPRTKDYLTRSLRPANNRRCKDYTESDSIRISEVIADTGAIGDAALNRSSSLSDFRDQLLVALSP